MNDLMVQEKEQLLGLTETKAKQIKAVFTPMMEKLEKVEEAYNNVVSLELTPETCVLAKRMRLDIAKIRIEAGKIKDEQKKEILLAGNAIQGIYNIIKFAVVSKEEKLKDIELHYEKIEEEKKAKLQLDRQVELEKYDADGEFVDLGNMPDEIWNNYLAGIKNNFESIKEAERKAEADLLAQEKKEAEERAAIKAENTRLRVDAARVAKKRIAEQRKIDAERKKQETKLRIAKERAEAEKRIQDEIIRQEREAKEKLEREIADKEAEKLALEKERAAKLKAEQKKASNAPDKEKLSVLIAVMIETRTLIKETSIKNYLHVIISDMETYTEKL